MQQQTLYALHAHYCKCFLSSYRMCVQVYLNGDGVGRGTHLSVFFVLMHGEYHTLQSPFRQQVTIALQGKLWVNDAN